MNMSKCFACTAAFAGVALMAGTASAQLKTQNEEVFSDNGSVEAMQNGQMITFDDANDDDANDVFLIDESITLVNDHWYNMETRVVVDEGATLTIEPGTVFGSTKTDAAGTNVGVLVIAPGSKINAAGTREQPIIFTSRANLSRWDDDASTTTGKDPRSRGQWEPGINEWGSIAVLGDARIGDTRQEGTNPKNFAGAKVSPIEGLPENPGGGADYNIYGGLDDNDNNGTMSYVSISYGGDNFDDLDNAELNGMSWGGTGREFDAHHIEIYNNVDDGLEIFGGSSSVKNLAIWNIGDDSFDVDQGWRGQAQFVLVVQGSAAQNVPQGSGFGDNGFEHDGVDGDAEVMPKTASQIFNATIIGGGDTPPGTPSSDSTDNLWELRDNLNMQIVNSIFMSDGQGAQVVEIGRAHV